MRAARQDISHKHFKLDSRKIRRAQKVLRAKTETETIERALDAILAEHKRNQLVAKANERFVASGITIKAKIREGYAAAQRGELLDAESVRRSMNEKKRAWLSDQRKK
jgi:hypothetical protein